MSEECCADAACAELAGKDKDIRSRSRTRATLLTRTVLTSSEVGEYAEVSHHSMIVL